MTLLYVLMLNFHHVKTTPSSFLLPPVLFGYDADAVMAVSHHDDRHTYKGYVVNSACVEHTSKKLNDNVIVYVFKVNKVYKL